MSKRGCMKSQGIPSHVWWSMGIDPTHPGDWALMSALSSELIFEDYNNKNNVSPRSKQDLQAVPLSLGS
jgi:hypothetical protein